MLFREWIGSTNALPWRHNHYLGDIIPFHLHYHPEYEITLTAGANGLRYLGDDVSDFTDVDLTLIAPNLAHSWQGKTAAAHEQIEIHVVFFREEWLHQLAEQGLPELRELGQWLRRIRHGVIFSRKLATQLTPRFAQLLQLKGLERVLCLLDLLRQLPSDTDARYLELAPANEPVGDPRLKIALDFLHQHYRESITLSTLAKAANINETTLKRLIARQVGKSFSDLLAELRLGHACNLLLTTQHTLPRVALDSGFPSLSNFHRQFTAKKGISAAKFRKNRGKPFV